MKERQQYTLPINPGHRIKEEDLAIFLADVAEANDQHFEVSDDGKPKSFTITAPGDDIYFCKRILVTKKLVRKAIKNIPHDVVLGPEDEFMNWETVAMKRPCYCRVIGTKILSNGIKHGDDDPKYKMFGIPRFQVTSSITGLLVVRSMNSAPFLIPKP